MIKNYSQINIKKDKFNLKGFLFILCIALFSYQSNQAQTPIDFEDFETGWGIWNDGDGGAGGGNNDANRVNASQPNGNWAINLQDNSGVASSIYTNDINLATFNEVSISFDYHSIGFNPTEDFFVEFSNNGGAGWSIIGNYVVVTDFNNGVDYNTTILIDDATYSFSASSRFRIRCDASGNGDDVYIDDIDIIGDPPQFNDDCSGAISLTPSVDNTCNAVTGDSSGATESQPDCVGFADADDDVWYSFVATSTNHDVTVTAGSIYDLVLEVFSGTCAGLTSIDCSDDNWPIFDPDEETISLNSLTIGATYYVRTYSYGGVGNEGTFDICVTTPPTFTNDVCANAIALPSPVTSTCNYTSATNVGATDSGVADPGCAFYVDDDAWFSVVVPANGQVDIDTQTGSMTDSGMAVYSGTCAGTLTLIECDDDDSPNGAMSYISVTGRTPGETLYIRVWDWGGGNGTFGICASTPPACTAPNDPAAPINFVTVTNNSIDGNFGASPGGADGYLVLMNTTGVTPTPPPVDGTTYNIGNTISGATVIDNDGNTNFTANGLNASTTYYFFIYAYNNTGCSGGPIYSIASLNGNETTDAPSLCIPSSTDDSLDYIDDFSATGSNSLTNNNTGAGITSTGYSDFRPLSVSQIEGGIVNFTVDFSGTFDTYGFNIWIDLNNDLDFDDANEKVYTSGGFFTNITDSFTIPTGITAGTYVMRIRADYFSTDPDPCNNISFGEAEDYNIVITELLCDDNPTDLFALVTSGTTATLSWTEPLNPPGNGYDYIISLDDSTVTPGDDITGSTTGNSVNLSGLTSNTQYYVFVRSDCGGTDGQGVWIPLIFDTCAITVTTPSACPLIVDEQGTNPFVADPFVSDPSFLIGCGNPSVTLEAHSQMQETTSYRAEKIIYNPPIPFFNLAASPINVADDDVWADAYSTIPFDFCFYGNTYNQFLVGANGNITFDSSIAPGSLSGYAFSNNLPSTAGALFEQTIYGVYHDIDPSASTTNEIFSRIVNPTDIGCRKIVVVWKDVPMFSDNSILYSGMIVLHETTNIIEVFIEEKRIDDNNVFPWNDGNAIIGVQGDITPLAPNNQYEVANCRNGLDTNWETTNEAWRFVPDGAAINATSINWYDGSGTAGTLVGTGSTLTRGPGQGGTYTAEATYNICGNSITVTDEVVVTQGSGKIWNGSTGLDNWTNANNWTPNGVPTSLDCITIPVIGSGNYPVIYGGDDGDGLNLTINSGANLTLDNNTFDSNYATLTIVDFIDLEASSQLVVNSSSSLVQVNEGAANVNNNSGSGNLVLNRDTNIRQEDYVYWSSPVEVFSLSGVYGANTPPYTYQWRQTIPNGFTPPPSVPICYGDWESYTGNMSLGKGYISRGPIGHTAAASVFTATFIGKPNNGVITQPIVSGNNNISNPNFTYNPYGTDILTVTPFDDNWNLIGNPYPSALSANAFLSHPNNNIIEGAVHIWTHGSALGTYPDSFYDDFALTYNRNDYITYNLSGVSNPNPTFPGFIGAGQGFFVLALNDSETGSVTFNNSMRSRNHDNSDFYRMNSDISNTNYENIERHRIWLNLLENSSGQASSTLIGYIEGATQEKDRLYDAYTFESNTMSIYSMIHDKRMTIQGRQLPFEDDDLVPLGVDVLEDGSYTIAINTLDGLFEGINGQNIYLEDTYLNTIHDLRTSPYTFSIEAGSYEDRFVLRYTNDALSINETELNTGLLIYVEDKLVKLKSKIGPIDSVVVYDVLGRTLIKVDDLNQLDVVLKDLQPSEGVLFVRAKLTDGREKIQKIVY
ncbi:GEVED domain-containing protein [Ichthyenterobacterium sp. W332]|uniref:GEVED domain-containing protein n=1 Tax=Microcosmobacter mediterraneus TaxID=3075607 RepID=A0ABU2YLP3_9FLAO|nr:GEVED domain-containing protein [Ichthyenterobacterium sp. W332]MDT0559073.1 GEVED domain-containing protein [Ichthyenterobacterium sp. W332]